MTRMNVFCISLFWVFGVQSLFAQKIQSTKDFFADTSVIRITISTDVRELQNRKSKPVFQSALFTWHDADSGGDVTEKVKIKQRGNMRKQQCNLAALMIDFSIKDSSSRFQNFGEFKWVAPCNFNKESEQWVLKEYLVYKLYNVFTDKSFRVRLVQLTLKDEKQRAKTVTNYAFAIEPVKAIGKRLNYEEVKDIVIKTEQTNRAQTTLIMLFQYMIGNTDWAVPNNHNIKLLTPADSPNVAPYIFPYDFDYSGIVNTTYAVPYEGLPISTVLERYYLGFPRTMDELKRVITYMLANQNTCLKIIEDFPLLSKIQKGQMLNYLHEFFNLITSERYIQVHFIESARRN